MNLLGWFRKGVEGVPAEDDSFREEWEKDRKIDDEARIPGGHSLLVRELLLTEAYTRENFNTLLSGLRALGIDSLESLDHDGSSPVDAVADIRTSPLWSSREVCTLVRDDLEYDPAIRIFPILRVTLPVEIFSISLAVDAATPSTSILTARFILTREAAMRLAAAINAPYRTKLGPLDRRGFRPRWSSVHLRGHAVSGVYASLRQACTAWMDTKLPGVFSTASQENERPACWVVSTDSQATGLPNFGTQDYLHFSLLDYGRRLFKLQACEAFLQLDDILLQRNGDVLFGSTSELAKISWAKQPVVVDGDDGDDWQTAPGYAIGVGNAVRAVESYYVWRSILACLRLKYLELAAYRDVFGGVASSLGTPKVLRDNAEIAARLLFDSSTLEVESVDLSEKPLFTTRLPQLDHAETRWGSTGITAEEELRGGIKAAASANQNLRRSLQETLPIVSAFHNSASSISSQRVSKVVAILALLVSISSLLLAAQNAAHSGSEAPATPPATSSSSQSVPQTPAAPSTGPTVTQSSIPATQ